MQEFLLGRIEMTKNISSVINSSPDSYWLSCIDYFKDECQKYAWQQKDLKYIISELEKNIKAEKTGRSTNWIVLGIIIFSIAFINKIKQKGIFRPSKYNFRNYTVEKSLAAVLKEKLDINKGIEDYFISIKNLYLLSKECFILQREMITSLKKGKEDLLSQIISETDFIFMLRTMSIWDSNEVKSSNDIKFYSPEDVSDALSYIIHLYHENIGEIGYRQLKYDNRKKAKENILHAAKIKKIRETEVKIDAFKHILKSSANKNCFKLMPLDEYLEVSKNLGYIYHQTQEFIDFSNAEITGYISIEDFAKKIIRDLEEEIIEYKTNIYPRYTLKFPTKFIELISVDSLFLDEVLTLNKCQKEWNISVQELLKFKIFKEITIKDIIKTQRFFNICRYLLNSKLEPLLKTNQEIILNSLVPFFKEESLKEILFYIVGDNNEDIIEFLSYSIKEKNVYDILYQPILKTGKEYILPINIIANSNISRNSLQLSQQRFFSDGRKDPLTESIFTALKNHSQNIDFNKKYKWKGIEGDVDVIALIGNNLFIIECKNSLFPSGIYEARTSYDHIIKAGDQLDKISSLLRDGDFISYLETSLGWKIKNTTITTAIIISNRMFTGYRVGSHPVRGSLEFINFIETGNIGFQNEKLCLWQENKFTGNDLVEYLKNDILHKILWKGVIKESISYDYGKYTLREDIYALNSLTIAKECGFKETVKKIEELSKQ